MSPGDSIVLTNRESSNFTKTASDNRILMKTSVLDGQENKAKPDKLVRVWHLGAKTDFTVKPRKKRTNT